MNPFKKLSLLVLVAFPFILGSSNTLKDDEPFTLWNSTTFSPGSQATVTIHSYNKINLQYKFTLLKVTDPVKFFTLRNPSYNFDIWGNSKDILLRYTEKVKEWKDLIGNPGNRVANVKVGIIEEPGIYILQAVSGNLVAYCALVVTDLSIVYKTSPGRILAFVTNVKTSRFIKDVNFTLVQNNKSTGSHTDKDGLVMFKLDNTTKPNNEAQPRLFASTGNEILVSNPYIYFGREDAQLITAYIYSNQPVYRPGQEVSFKAILRSKDGNELKNLPLTDFSVSVKTPKNKEIYSGIIKTDDLGTLSGTVKLDEAADLGNYSIILSKGDNNYYGSFEVQEYRKTEYQVKVEIPKTNYANNDQITGKVKADYYFGSPVTTGTVALKIYKRQYWRPWWYWSDYSWFYRGFDKIGPVNWHNLTFVKQMDGELDKYGEYNFTYDVNEDKNADFVYIISAEVTDASRMSVSGSSNVNITRGSFSIFTTPDKYFTETGKPVLLKINASDFDDKPIQTDFRITITYPRYPENNPGNTGPSPVDEITGRTDNYGKAIVTYLPNGMIPGYYNYSVTAKDEKGREITSRSSFYYGESSYYRNSSSGVEIVTDKDAYEKGDSLTAYIFLPSPNTEFLLTYESGDIFYYKKYTATEKSIVIKELLDDKFAPGFNISVVFMKDGQFFNNTKQVGVLAKDKFLNISIRPDKKEYKPGDNAAYQLLVKDYKGNPVENTALSFGVVDESIYAVKEDETQDIKSFFYAPQYSYIPISNSYFYTRWYGQSRVLTEVDNNFFQRESKERKGTSSLYGRLTTKANTGVHGYMLYLISKNDFYETETDTAGDYVFNNIIPGTYSLYYCGNQSIVMYTENLTVGKKSKYDMFIENAELIVRESQQIGGVRFGQNTMAMDMDLKVDRLPLTALNKSLALENSGVVYKEAVVRSNFQDAAFWKADVRTDSHGIAEVKFKMPDNLTTWRTTVRGITSGSDVGQELNKTITRKNLLIRMEPPRFFREGDEITVSTIVYNYLNEKKRTKISFKGENLSLVRSDINTPGYSTNLYNQKEGLYELTIDKNTELRIDWVVKVNVPIGEAKLKAEALTNTESDALELTVPIIPKGIKEVKSVTAELSSQPEETLKFNIPEDVDLRSAIFSFTAVPSLSATMLKALDDLTGYPYGCVEQTMSRFLPTIIAANTFRDLNIPVKSKTLTELPDMVDAGLKRLYHFQHQDGGWGWWENDNTHPYMTAYVIYGMNLAMQAGYKIDNAIYKNGIDNLYSQVKNYSLTPNMEPTTLSFMLYALSSSGEQQYKSFILDKIKGMDINKLNSYALSLNIISLVNLKENSMAENFTSRLLSIPTSKGGMVFWSGKEWHYNWQDDNVQSTSFAVKALIKSGSKSDYISKAVQWLILQKQGYSWRSTQETAAVIFALSDYLKTTNELTPDYSYSVYLNGNKIISKKVGTADVYTNPEEIKISGLKENALIKGENTIRIVKEGTGKLYFSGMNQYYTMNETFAAKGVAFNVRREYYLLKPVQKDGRLIYTKEEFNGRLKSGDEIFVKTFVDTKADNLQYLILEDMLPSGFETIKDDGKYEVEGENDYHPYYNKRGFMPWRWFYADKEYRDQKVSFFVTNVNRQMEFSYLMKAQIPGKITVSPAQAYLMYYPEVNGNSGWVEINVRN